MHTRTGTYSLTDDDETDNDNDTGVTLVPLLLYFY